MTDVQRIIDENGKPVFGIFPEPVEMINYRDFDYRTPMGKVAGPIRKWFGFNRFQYFGVISDELIFGCAIADIRAMGVAFIYLYQPGTGEMIEHTFRSPFAGALSMALSPVNGMTVFENKKNRIEMIYRNGPSEKALKVNLDGGLKVDARFSETSPIFQPMCICTQTGPNGWVYAQKAAGVDASGTVECEFGGFDLETIGAMAHHDYSAGFMRRETFWNWACFSGRTPAGDRIGLNVSCGVNETSFSENCWWLNGELINTGLARFEYDKDEPMRPWRVSTGDGGLDLAFQPEGQHVEHLNAIILASNFKQIFGKFNGLVRHPDGYDIEIKDQYGFVEDQYSKW